jgi:hypothetical protein
LSYGKGALPEWDKGWLQRGGATEQREVHQMHSITRWQNLTVTLLLCASFVIAMPTHAQSAADCAARADRAARESSGVLGGAAAGGAGGALFGAIVSDKSSKGARRGAALGAVVGGAHGAYRKDQTYKRVYDDCMAGRW